MKTNLKLAFTLSFPAVVFGFILMSACTSGPDLAPRAGVAPAVDSASPVVAAAPAGAGEPNMFLGYLAHPQTGKVIPWWMENRGGMAVVDGDIVLGRVEDFSEPGSSKASFYAGKGRLWKKAIVPYLLPASFPNRKVVLAAIKQFEGTGLRFEPYTGAAHQKDYIEITLLPNTVVYELVGGQSAPGRQGGRQLLEMNANKSKWNEGTVVHELGHAVGMAHEQCRQDRRNHITIIEENVAKGFLSQFSQKFTVGGDQGPYDFESVMHYPWDAFSKSPGKLATMVAVNSKAHPPGTFGHKMKLSARDRTGLAIRYEKEIQDRGN